MNLTELTARQIAAEDACTRAGRFALTALLRREWGQSDSAMLWFAIQSAEYTAAYAIRNPYRFVLQAGERVFMPYDVQQERERETAITFLSPAVIEACRHSAEIAADKERRRRAVD